MIGRRLREALKLRGISQAELARRLNMDMGAINRWATNKNTPDVDSVIAMAKELRVSTDWLLGLVEGYNDKLDPNSLSPIEYRLLAILDSPDPLTAIRQFVDLLEEARREEESPGPPRLPKTGDDE